MLRSFRNLEKQIRYNQCGRKNLGITILQNVCKYSHFCSLVLDDMEFPDWTGMLYFCHSSFCLFYSVEATWELIKSYSWQTANSQKSTGLFKRFSITFTCFQVILKSYCICFEQYWFSFLLIVCTEREALTCFASLLLCLYHTSDNWWSCGSAHLCSLFLAGGSLHLDSWKRPWHGHQWHWCLVGRNRYFPSRVFPNSSC